MVLIRQKRTFVWAKVVKVLVSPIIPSYSADTDIYPGRARNFASMAVIFARVIDDPKPRKMAFFYMWAATCAGLCIAWYLTASFTAYRGLRDFRGPFLASFSYLWLLKAVLSGRAYEVHAAARKRHGGPGRLIRIGPDMLITDDAAVARHINAPRSGYSKPSWYSVMRLDPYVHNMISSTDLDFHDDVKARTAAGYTGREVPSMEADVDGQIESLKALIRRRYLSTSDEVRPLDWGFVAQYFTVDSLTKVAYGTPFGCLAEDSDVHEYIRTVEEMGFYFALCSDVPWLGKIFLAPWILKLFGPKPSDKVGLGVTME
jgi:hypothetical protein